MLPAVRHSHNFPDEQVPVAEHAIEPVEESGFAAEQMCDTAEESAVEFVAETEAEPSVELEVGPVEVGPAVELEAEPSVELEVGPAVEPEAQSSVELRAEPLELEVEPVAEPVVESAEELEVEFESEVAEDWVGSVEVPDAVESGWTDRPHSVAGGGNQAREQVEPHTAREQ